MIILFGVSGLRGSMSLHITFQASSHLKQFHLVRLSGRQNLASSVSLVTASVCKGDAVNLGCMALGYNRPRNHWCLLLYATSGLPNNGKQLLEDEAVLALNKDGLQSVNLPLDGILTGSVH